MHKGSLHVVPPPPAVICDRLSAFSFSAKGDKGCSGALFNDADADDAKPSAWCSGRNKDEVLCREENIELVDGVIASPSNADDDSGDENMEVDGRGRGGT